MKSLITKYLGLYGAQKQRDTNNILRCDGAIEALKTLLKELEDENAQAGEGAAVPDATSTEAAPAASPN